MSFLTILLACTGTSGPPAVEDGEAIALRAVPPASVELAPRNRSKEPPEAMRLEEWSQGRNARSGAVRWTHDLPIRKGDVILEGGKKLDEAGLRSIKSPAGVQRIELGSGSYEFRVGPAE